MLYENSKMALNLYQVSYENKVSILVNPISNCAYPGHLDTYKEDNFYDGPPHDSVYIFGIDLLAQNGITDLLLWIVSITIIGASVIALNQDNLKRRLAYSTISQLSYVVLGAVLASTASVTGATLHIATHAVGKITLFFCAGAILVAAHNTRVSDLDGLGRQMPITMGAFFIASVSIAGLPPMAGMWGKW